MTRCFLLKQPELKYHHHVDNLKKRICKKSFKSSYSVSHKNIVSGAICVAAMKKL